MSDASPPPGPARFRLTTAHVGGAVLVIMILGCVGSLFWTTQQGYYNRQYLDLHYHAPSFSAVSDQDVSATVLADSPPWQLHMLMGTDGHGRSMLARCLLGGAISLSVGLLAAAISVLIGTTWGMVAGYVGGRTDAAMMRIVDVLYGLPYILLVILLSIAVSAMVDRYRVTAAEHLASPEMDGPRNTWMAALAKADEAKAESKTEGLTDAVQQERLNTAHLLKSEADGLDPRSWGHRLVDDSGWVLNLLTLMVAIGSVSWLTLARVVRGQVLSLKSQPFVEAARAIGCSPARVLFRHVLPNLIGPVIVYTTLTVPEAILYESFLSFLGIGVQPPLPSWGNLASEGLKEINPVESYSWLLLWPCLLLGMTLLALNFVGDGLRDRFDPKAAKPT